MKRAALLALAAGVIFCALVLPNHPGTMKWTALARWPLELPVILLGVAAFGWRSGVTHLVALLLTLGVAVKLADYATFEAYNRLFNPVVDFYLIHPAFTLLSDSIGRGWALAAFAAGIAGIIALFLLFLACLRLWAGVRLAWPLRGVAAVIALLSAGWATADAGHHLKAWTFEQSPPGSAWTSRLLVNRGIKMQAAAADLIAFTEAASQDPYVDRENLLDALGGRDVILIWIESYGRASFDNPLYTDTHLDTLRAAAAEIGGSGLAMQSGWLTAPTAGGQSWLSHATLASGLWINDQARYAALLALGHKWLFHIAQDAGYRTAAVMPAITMAWPESLSMGFDRVIPAADMPYRGERFRWVTMPDQFTLSAYPDLLPPDTRPDFLQIALISSHAPWTPIADMVPWQAVGDGTIFNEMAARGPTPKELWDDRDDVRDAYRRSVDYALRVTFSHVARLAAAAGETDAPLVIVAGDHQSAPFVAGSDNHDVAVHMIGPASLLDRIAHWGWTPGLIPDADGPVRPMDTFRGDFIDAFTTRENPLVLSQ